MKALGHIFIIIALLMSSFGQALAQTTKPCHTQLSMMHQDTVMADMGHNAHDNTQDRSISSILDESMDMDCCQSDCQCDLTACSSVFFIAVQQYMAQRHHLDDMQPVALTESTKTHPASLFRPPINA